MNGIILISLLIGGLSWYVSSTLQRRFKEYSQLPIRYTGREVAKKMLRDNKYKYLKYK
mgnify:CR=1 FL=1